MRDYQRWEVAAAKALDAAECLQSAFAQVAVLTRFAEEPRDSGAAEALLLLAERVAKQAEAIAEDLQDAARSSFRASAGE